jgi:hypothetical protein
MERRVVTKRRKSPKRFELVEMSVKLGYILRLVSSIATTLAEAVRPNTGEISSTEALPSFVHHISK